jgi:hypothetical protein
MIALVRFFLPSVVVVREAASGRDGAESEGIWAIIEVEALCSAIEMIVVKSSDIERCFGALRKMTKHEIAARIALHFPELTWRLPPPKKPWEKEHYNTPMFDAVSVGIVYWEQTDNPAPGEGSDP